MPVRVEADEPLERPAGLGLRRPFMQVLVAGGGLAVSVSMP